jgi:RimJ/RimL family protein N-acetyltransferase
MRSRAQLRASMPTMIIARTERLDIRPWTEEPADLDRMFDIYSRWEVSRWLGAAPKAMADRDEALERVRRWRNPPAEWRPEHGVWAIEVRETGIVAGTVLFKPLPNSDGSPARDIEVGWHLHPDAWGHGYATEAARAVVDRGFAAGLTEVFAVTHLDNTASQAVCRRLGMAPIGETDRWYGMTVAAFRLAASG